MAELKITDYLSKDIGYLEKIKLIFTYPEIQTYKRILRTFPNYSPSKKENAHYKFVRLERMKFTVLGFQLGLVAGVLSFATFMKKRSTTFKVWAMLGYLTNFTVGTSAYSFLETYDSWKYFDDSPGSKISFMAEYARRDSQFPKSVIPKYDLNQLTEEYQKNLNRNNF